MRARLDAQDDKLNNILSISNRQAASTGSQVSTSGSSGMAMAGLYMMRLQWTTACPKKLRKVL